jgi:membrane protein
MAASRVTAKQRIAAIWQLGGLSRLQLAKHLWEEFLRGEILTQAAAVAYSFFLAVFPLLLFLTALFGIFAAHRLELQHRLFQYLAQILPPVAYQVVAKTFEEIVRSSGGEKMTFGVLLALWSGAGGMTALISGLNAAYKVRERRSFQKVRLMAIGLTVVSSILVLAALSIVLLGDTAADFAGSRFHSVLVMAIKVLQWPIALTFLIFAYALVYYFGPDVKEQHWYWITPGSIVGVLLWLLVSLALRIYLHFFNSYSATYGSLGAVIILLLWFYATGFAFLVGGEINAEIEQAAALGGDPEAKLAGEKAA